MTWRDQLRKASFRGVEFFVDSAEGAFGRRNVTHEYPKRDKPYVEDLGRKARSFTLEAYVLATAANGLNYMPGRDALIAALEQDGSGVLMHPYLGEMRVALQGEAKLRELTREGGIAHFTLTFVESGEAIFPSAQANTPSIVNMKADAAEAAVAADFAKKFKVDGLPEFVSKAATDLLGNVSTMLSDVTKLIPSEPGALAEFLPQVKDFASKVGTLVHEPMDLAQTVMAQVDRLRAVAKNPLDAFGITDPRALVKNPKLALQMLRKLFDFGKAGTPTPVESVPTTTPARVQQLANQNAVQQLVQRSAVISAARSSAATDYASLDDAAAVRSELSERMDTLMQNTDSDDVYNALSGLRAATSKDLTTRGADLGRLVSFTPGEATPAVVLAYDLYQDAGRDGEIVLRNSVRYPGFVPGGRPVAVLADG